MHFTAPYLAIGGEKEERRGWGEKRRGEERVGRKRRGWGEKRKGEERRGWGERGEERRRDLPQHSS